MPSRLDKLNDLEKKLAGMAGTKPGPLYYQFDSGLMQQQIERVEQAALLRRREADYLEHTQLHERHIEQLRREQELRTALSCYDETGFLPNPYAQSTCTTAEEPRPPKK